MTAIFSQDLEARLHYAAMVIQRALDASARGDFDGTAMEVELLGECIGDFEQRFTDFLPITGSDVDRAGDSAHPRDGDAPASDARTGGDLPF